MTQAAARRTGRLDVTRPFSRAQAAAAGVALSDLRRVSYRVVFPGVYLSADVALTPALRAEAALVPFPDSAVASHASAARIHGLPIPTIPDEHVTVFQQKDRRHRRGIRCHLASTTWMVRVRGVPVSSYEQTFVELAELIPLVDLVVVGDHLVRKGHTTAAALIEFCASSKHGGAPAARLAAGHVRPDVDSPMETRLRMLLVLAGLPEPTVNRTIRDVYGQPIRRYDLSYAASKTIVEYDGRQHAERVEQWEKDLARREAIEDDRWRIIVVVSSGIFEHPERTLCTIHRVLRERGEPGVPVRLSDAWRPHFPGRG
jgi:hypothetical protein